MTSNPNELEVAVVAQPAGEIPTPDLTGCELVMPLQAWLEQQEQGEQGEGACTPCSFALIAPWYKDILIEGGYPELAQRIDAITPEDGSGREVDLYILAETLDSIKQSVDNENVRNTLVLYDCMGQSYSEEGEGEGEGQWVKRSTSPSLALASEGCD